MVYINEVAKYRRSALREAFEGFKQSAKHGVLLNFEDFIEKNQFWLDDYALFRAIRHAEMGPWWTWRNLGLRNYESNAIAHARDHYAQEIRFYCFEQFVFFEQWQEVRDYASQKGVQLFGDMPFFVAEDSVEMWSKRDYFLTDEEGRAKFVAGSPPQNDYARPNKGQCWGNPLYNWETLQESGFSWWRERLNTMSRLFDIVRLTHFRGYRECWAVPRSDDYAHCLTEEGHWEDTPDMLLFSMLNNQQGQRSTLVAENIQAPGLDAEKTDILLRKSNLPEIKVLQLAFDLDMGNPHYPHQHHASDVVYTGTHDSQTTMEWLKRFALLEKQTRKINMLRYLDLATDVTCRDTLHRIIDRLYASPAKLVILPMQDILELEGNENRMNIPGVSKWRNWRWRFDWGQITPEIKLKLLKLSEKYGRVGCV
ncbi:4-alpha-glucanotransferase [Thioflexithrix psekupsensis]|uniref:4-alpha-glucanotransferase n=1 Tax=Thioflexithrix psekupsensis TaxID=1570016 RepID=A0A251XBU3_9GAMM|nr:4-alpha-glucanotransferase [Thioflexithrix psekupsensis]OUD13344.1 4-alpha-glucanotransferase [Thioflexithrix psekupsensis]OUD16013.1 4-alpha-glucanotransferase [Thioflexithrix psekupsensis]